MYLLRQLINDHAYEINYLYSNGSIEGLNSVIVETFDHAYDINFAYYNF